MCDIYFKYIFPLTKIDVYIDVFLHTVSTTANFALVRPYFCTPYCTSISMAMAFSVNSAVLSSTM